MVKASVLIAERLKSLRISPDPEENTLDEVLLDLAFAGQHDYVGAYYRNKSLEEFNKDNERWRERYLPISFMKPS